MGHRANHSSFPPARGVAPLVEFSAGDERAVVGVLIQGVGLEDGAARGKAAVLPTLAIHPYLFDNPDVDKSGRSSPECWSRE
ncbi:MAG: hypothetical protein U1E05_02300 [Patescibacteria group bacterium]|nr:hypothetical protein [Patescibacteria group bacterium]